MNLRDLTGSATTSLIQNKSRSVLTILGIVIGIAAVILMLSIGQGAQALILNQVASLGSDQIFIAPGASETSGGPPTPFVKQSLKYNDVKELRKRGPFSFVAAQLISTGTVESADASKVSSIVGADEFQLLVFPAEVASGRFLDNTDVTDYAKVAVIGIDIASDLFGDSDPINQKITINKVNLRVIGVMERQGSRFFQNVDGYVYLPVTTAQRDVLGVDYISYIAARATGDLVYAKEEATMIMRDQHDINNPQNDLSKDDFHIQSQEDAVATIGIVGTALSVLLASIAAISLLVGGIGIMNIMLVSVTERTKEIGLRKAIGATEQEILRQFLLEAVILTSFGGVVGVLLGVTASYLIAFGASYFVAGWRVIIPPSAIVASVLVSTAVGLGFGYYPARRAAKLDPIEALRYE
ncbi:MAG: ABC transporter permease [Patescibacteria group bacterium]|jgi:putative ABC transport system permease protein